MFDYEQDAARRAALHIHTLREAAEEMEPIRLITTGVEEDIMRMNETWMLHKICGETN